MTGILAVEDPLIAPGERRYSIPNGHLEVLLEHDSLNWMVPLVRQTIGMVAPLQQLLEAYRSGAGVPYAAYGTDMREGIGLRSATFRAYAEDAGFSNIEILPIDNDFWRFYLLRP